MPEDEVEKLKVENFNQDFKHASEHYDEIIDEVCPLHVHRGDSSTVNRLLGYTDAMMATCATFLVLPLRNLKEMQHGQLLSDFVREQQREIIVFFIGFLVICTIWESINVRCIAIKRLDDILVLLSLIQKLAITLLPFSLALQGHFPKENVSTLITIITLTIVELIEICIIFYAFSKPRTIHYAVRTWTDGDRRKFRLFMCFKPIGNLIIILLAGLFSLLDYRISAVLVSLLILVPILRKFGMFYFRRVMPPNRQSCYFFHFYGKGNISKERVEAFTDAAVAIIACVLILDITVEEFPKSEYVFAHGLLSALQHMAIEFIVFLGTYTTVSLLWYVNHTILHLFHTINIVVLYLQKIFLAFLCLAPLASGMLNEFISKEDENSIFAIRVVNITVFASSICNLLMLLWGYYKDEKFIHKWASKSYLKLNRNEHLYVLLKTCNMPFWSLVSFIATFGSEAVARYVFDGCIIANLVSFIALKLIFMNVNNEICNFDEQDDEGEKMEEMNEPSTEEKNGKVNKQTHRDHNGSIPLKEMNGGTSTDRNNQSANLDTKDNPVFVNDDDHKPSNSSEAELDHQTQYRNDDDKKAGNQTQNESNVLDTPTITTNIMSNVHSATDDNERSTKEDNNDKTDGNLMKEVTATHETDPNTTRM